MSEPLEYEPGSPPPGMRPPRGRWRWVKRFGGSALLSLLSFVGWVVIDRAWTRRDCERQWAAARAVVDAEDPDWTWERVNETRAKPPAGRNGADLIPEIKKQLRPEWGKALATPEFAPLLDVPPNERFGGDVLAQVRSELDASAEAVKLARALKDCPFGHRAIVLKPDVLNTLLPDTQNTRHAADLLKWAVVVATADGDARRTADDLMALLNASRSLGDEPFLISQMVRIAVRGVAVRSAERAVAQRTDLPLADLQAALLADADEPLLLYGLRGDRAALDRLLENLETGAVGPDAAFGPGGGPPFGRLGWWRYRASLPNDRADLLTRISWWVEVARRPVHEQPALAAGAPPHPPADAHLAMSRVLLPAAEKVAHAYWRSVAEARCAAVGLACERFRQKHDRWPGALADLVPAFLPTVPLDPYGGNPLQYAKSATGAAVYSVGRRPTTEVRTAAPPVTGLPDGAEFGFRLFDPLLRGRPAPLPVAPPPRLAGPDGQP
jgi:hypothetical protein